MAKLLHKCVKRGEKREREVKVFGYSTKLHEAGDGKIGSNVDDAHTKRNGKQ